MNSYKLLKLYIKSCEQCNGCGLIKCIPIKCKKCNGNKCYLCNGSGYTQRNYKECEKCYSSGRVLNSNNEKIIKIYNKYYLGL